MDTLTMAATGGNFLSAFMSYEADKAEAKARRAWQAYQNKMVQLSAGLQQDALTTNQIFAMDALTQQGFQADRQTMDTLGSTEVAAAAAGVKGKSVNLAMRDVMRTAGMRQAERQEAFKNTMLGFETQRRQVAMSAAMQKEYSYIPKPKMASYLLQAGMKSISMVGGA